MSVDLAVSVRWIAPRKRHVRPHAIARLFTNSGPLSRLKASDLLVFFSPFVFRELVRIIQ